MGLFRYPRTPHLAWLGDGRPRDDKVLSDHAARDFLAHEIVVEEKLDGANVGFCLDESGVVAYNRGTVLSPGASHAQFAALFPWLARREHALLDALFPQLVLFGEWCYAKHSLPYAELPDWFLVFDVYDGAREEFWSTGRRDQLAQRLGLHSVPRLAVGRYDLAGLQSMMSRSRFWTGAPEGLYLRRDEGAALTGRAKLVRPGFIHPSEQHWSRRRLVANRLVRRDVA